MKKRPSLHYGGGSPSSGRNRIVSCPRDHRRLTHLITFLHVPSPNITLIFRNLSIRTRPKSIIYPNNKVSLIFLRPWPSIKRICWLASGEREGSWSCDYTTKGRKSEATIHMGVLSFKEVLSHFPNCFWKRISITGTEKWTPTGLRIGGRTSINSVYAGRTGSELGPDRSGGGLGGRQLGTQPGNRKQKRAVICFVQMWHLSICWQRQDLARSQEHKNILWIYLSLACITRVNSGFRYFSLL